MKALYQHDSSGVELFKVTELCITVNFYELICKFIPGVCCPFIKKFGLCNINMKIKGLPRCNNLTRFSLFARFCFAVRYCFKCFCFLCFTSSVSFTGSYTEVKPKLRYFPDVLSQSVGEYYSLPTCV